MICYFLCEASMTLRLANVIQDNKKFLNFDVRFLDE